MRYTLVENAAEPARIAYRLDEAASAIGVSVQTVRRWASRDGLPVFQRGRVQLVFVQDLIEFVRAAPARRSRARRPADSPHQFPL